jgi:outer membrane protein OmpA-like peptidoglycan-associated protein
VHSKSRRPVSGILNSEQRFRRTWAVSALLAFTISSLGFTTLTASSAEAAVTTTSVPDVAGSNTTITFNGSPIREGSTLAGGTTIGIGTSALLNPGVGQREIRTKYDSNTVYQAGTAQAPEGWTLSYSTNNGATWATTEPSPASGVTDIKATASSVAAGAISGYSQQFSTETSAAIPSSVFSASTGGDGWGITFYDNYIFNIYHHNDQTILDCYLRTTGARCAGYTKYITTVENGSTINYRAGMRSDAWVDAATAKLYAFTSPTSGSMANRAGVICVSISSTPTPCGFTPLTTDNTVNNYGHLSDSVNIGRRMFSAESSGTNSLVCFDAATNAQCANSPINMLGASGASWGTGGVHLETIGTRVFARTSSNMYCFNASDLSTCSGTWPATVTANTTDPQTAVHTDSTGNPDGVCSLNQCFNLSGVSQSWTNPFSVIGAEVNQWAYTTATTLGRTFSSNAYRMACFDYTTNAACAGFTSPNWGQLYSIFVDPENPSCLWTNSDEGQIKNLDAVTGALGCSSNPVITLQPSQFAPRYACSTSQGIDQWGVLKISQLAGGGSASAIRVTVRDANGNAVSGYTNRSVALNTDLDLSGMNVDLSGSRPTFSFAFSGITGSITSATIALEYKGKGPELCSAAVLNSPASATSAVVSSKSIDSVGLTNLYESQRNFTISTVNGSGLYLTVPSAPRNLSGTGLNSSATVTFAAPADNGGLDLSNYQYSLDGGSTFITISNLADNGDGTFSFAVSGLTPGQTYAIKVAASNSLGRGALASLSLTAQVVDFGNIPDTQQNAGPVYLSTQNSASLPYTYVATPSNVCTVASNVVTLIAVGTCSLTQNQAGDSTHIATTATSSFRVLANPVIVVVPGAPTLSSVTPASTQATLSWQAPVSDGNGAITDYVVQYKVGSSWVPFVDGSSTNTFAVITGLTNGTTYSFRIAAVNSAGQGTYSNVIDAVPATTPGAATALAAGKSGTSATLTWTSPSSNGGSAITDYRVQFKLSSEPSWSTFADPVTAATGATVTGLVSASTYDFQVTAKNAAGFGNSVSTVTLAATGQSAAIALSWAANTDGITISNHIVEYRVLGQTSWIQNDTASTNRSANLSGLVNGTSYEVRVARITGSGVGSSVSSYTSAVVGIPVTTPSAPTVSAAAGVGQAQLSWTVPSGNGSDVYDYVVQFRLVGAASWSTWVEGVSTATSAIVLGLANGSEYEFRVAALNAVGTGAYSIAPTGTPRTTPGAVSNLAITVSGVSMTLAWNAPSENGGAAVTDYVIQYKLLTDTTWTTLPRSASTSRTATISGLIQTTRYSVRVAAVNSAGPGSFGAAASEITGISNYTITYNYNGASSGSSIASADFLIGSSALVLPTPSRPNYHFDGWFDALTGGSLVGLGGASLVPSSNKGLFARWTQNSLKGIGSNTKIGSLTVSNGLGTQYTATGNNNSVTVAMPSGSLPDGTTLDIYLLSDSSTGRSLVTDSASFLVNLVVAWLATDGSVPTTAVGKPVVVTINDPSIKTGAAIYQLMNGVAQRVGTASQDGVAQVSITDDPQLVVAATAATAPLMALAAATDGSATVTWSAPASTGGADISGYVVTASTGQTCTSSTLSCTFTGLTNGAAVTFTVSALNGVGTGAASTATASVTPTSPLGNVAQSPQVPQAPTVTPTAIGQLTLPPLKPGVANSGQISGVSLDQLQGVSIGGKPATLSANGATSTNIVVPALAPGVYDITYTMANGQTGVIAGGLTVPATSKLPVGVAVVTRDPAAATVSVALPVDTSSDPARVAVLQIFDAKGKLVQTLTRPVGANAIDATFAIPVNLAGYKVVAFTKNQFGVSAGAPISAALIKVAAPVKRAANGNAVVTGKIVAPAVSFAANSAALPKSSAAAIKAAAAFVKANGGKLVITGFTNPSSAPAAAAQKIAAERALAVAVALRKLGVNVWMNYSGAGIFNSTASPTVNRKAVISWVPNGI